MTYHRTAGVHPEKSTTEQGLHTGQLHCHYCLAVNPLPEFCPNCKKKLSLFGLGTQRVEEELARKFPDVKCATRATTKKRWDNSRDARSR
jgi:primosomal protein N'